MLMSYQENVVSPTPISQDSNAIPDPVPSIKMKKSDYIGRFPQLWECLVFEMRQQPEKIWSVDELFPLAKKYEGI
jgi:hypothetical protein